MAVRFRLIVGLGNPTPKYDKTRHNAGFWFMDELAERQRLTFGFDQKAQGMLAKFQYEGEQIVLLKPMTYMNRSGGSVSAVARFYKIDPAQMLVAHDELDFAPGVVRLKVGGGHGGHNGLRDVVASLGAADFCRLRIGVGRPEYRDDVVNYVLDRPSRSDAVLIHSALTRAVDMFPQILRGDIGVAMNTLHA